MSSSGGSLPENLPDPKLVSQILTAHRQHLKQLLTAYQPYIRSLAEQSVPMQLRPRLDASDLAQETLLRGTAQLNQFQGQTEAELLAWLRQILQNLVVDWVRHHTAEKRDVRREIELNEPVPDDDGTPSQIYRKKEENERLTAAMQLLSDDHRIVIELRNRGLTFEEIGEQIGRTPDAARMLWGRAISRLVALLEDNAR